MDINEFEIPVPWGHVAVKAWGDKENTPVLAIHGLGDNAGTFDRLIPHLSTSFYYICIDLPSHGKSTHYPPHVFVSALDNILTIKLVVDYLNRKKYIFLGHSWGGQAQILFTQLYPEYVSKLIVLDAFYFFPANINTFKDYLREKIEILMKTHKNDKSKQTFYTYEEAVLKLIESRVFGELWKESAEALVKRCLIPVDGGKFQLSMDPRLKCYLNPLFDLKYVIKLLKHYPINCPMLFVSATGSKMQLQYFKVVLDEIQRRNKNCILKTAEGSHDVHSNSPELVGPLVNSFLVTKAWGCKEKTAVLTIHGYKDNAGSFDLLIPQLPTNFYYVCIDLPGHGQSSHFPLHASISFTDYLLAYKIVLDYLKRDKYIVIAHSWAGYMAVLFAQLYPELISQLIVLDALFVMPITVGYFRQYLTNRFELHLKLNKRIATRRPLLYTFDEAFTKLSKGRLYGQLKKEAVEALLKRVLIPVKDGKFQFTSDVRTTSIFNCLYGRDTIESILQKYPITCPVLFIMASDSIPFMQYFDRELKLLQKLNKMCYVRIVNGNHEVHMNNPEIVAPIVSRFLINFSKL